jgi:hypothetical protein
LCRQARLFENVVVHSDHLAAHRICLKNIQQFARSGPDKLRKGIDFDGQAIVPREPELGRGGWASQAWSFGDIGLTRALVVVGCMTFACQVVSGSSTCRWQDSALAGLRQMLLRSCAAGNAIYRMRTQMRCAFVKALAVVGDLREV